MKKHVLTILMLYAFATLEAQNDSISSIMRNAQKGDAIAQNKVGAWYYKGTNVEQDYAIALQWWAKSAQQGNVSAIGNMGLCYQYGRGIEKDSVMALQLYLRSIKSGNKTLLQERMRFAQKNDNFNAILAALCYQNGIGTGKDLNKAVAYYQSAAQNNSVDGQRELALCLLNQKQEKQAASWFKQAAANQDRVSCFYYGKMLMIGQGTIEDKQQAVIYWIQAAEKGFAQAQYELGKLYLTGETVPQDKKQATEWFERAALQGSPHAQWNLALCYLKGEGIESNYHQALHWFGEASAKGYKRSFEKHLHEATEDGWKETPFFDYIQGMYYYIVEENLNKAFDCFKKVDKKKIIEGKTMLGICYANENCKKYKLKKAIKTLQKASIADKVAQFHLGILYEKIGNKQSIALLQSSANNGYAEAQCYLGDLYFEGRGVEQDYAKAVAFYQRAENQGILTDSAAKRYAACYENGWGNLLQDKKKARSLLKERVIENGVKKLLEQNATNLKVE